MMMTTEQITPAQFIQTANLNISTERVMSRPDSDAWGATADHWFVTLKTSRRQMSFYYSKGSGLRVDGVAVPPTLLEVLESLALDSLGYLNSPLWESYAGEYGLNVDSLKEYRTFKLVRRQTDKLRSMLGDVWFNLLVYGTNFDG